MDVFNGLEDVRQYFQGLPAATGATASPGYQHQSNNGGPSDPGHDRSSSTSNVPYWPPQHELQARPPTRESTPQRPASHHSDSSSSRPPSHHNIQHAGDPKSRTNNSIQVASSVGYPYINHEPQSGAPQQQSFQFSVPHSRESNASSQQQQQRIPSRSSDLTSPQSYHQLQPPQNQTAAQQQPPSNQNYSYENHSSYYNNKTGIAPINAYKGAIALQQTQQQASSQQRIPTRTSDLTNPQAYHQQNKQQTNQNSYSYENHMYYNHNPPISSNNSNNKTAATPINSYAYKTYPPQGQSHAVLDGKEHALNNHNTQQQQQQQQQHKSTHNLPPIAALSNYHTGRSSREALRIPTSRPNKIATTTTTTSTNKQYNVPQPVTQPQSRVPHPNHPGDNIPAYRNVSQYSNYHHSSPSYYSVTSATTSTNNTNNSYSTPSYPQTSSAMQHQGNIPPKTINQQQYLQNSSAVDSVLDLSLKTIKTPADSTLDDSEENQRNNKYYQRQQSQNQQQQMVSQHNQVRYPESYANNQRNVQHASSRPAVQQLSTGAPKVDFLPNFNMPMTQNYKTERRQVISTYEKAYQQQSQNQQTQRHHQPQQAVNMQQQYNPAQVLQNNSYVPSKKTPMEGLPRIDFPPTNQMQKGGGSYQSSHDRKRSATQQLSNVVQNKKPRMDDRWRQVIDKQIEQKFSSYQSSKPAAAPQAKDLVVNGNFLSSNEKNTYQPNQYQMQTHHQYTPSPNSQYHQMNQTYVPSAAAHHYPSHITHGQQQQMHPQQQTQQQQQQHALYQQNLTRSNSHTSLNSSNNNRSQQGADKRIISILRSNLEMKGANKEAQKKMEQTQFKAATYDFNQRPREVQHPSTDVTAPLQPKHGFIGRQNVSPFTAASLIERSTPPTYKFPKAIDSIRFEEEKSDHSSLTNQADLDGLAANLAARIRTKGELKQVSQHANYMRHTSPGLSLNDIPLNGSTNAPNSSPPKEKAAYPPRRRLFSRNEEDQGEQKSIAPPRDKTGMRSSSETSVFDFPDSGDESVPMFERQSLEDMRRDRKSISKQSLVNENDFKDEKISRVESPIDDFFNQACDNFLEQLMKGGGKKRGRRKKMEPDVLAKLETVTKEKPLNSENPEEFPPVIKIEETPVTKEEPEDDPPKPVNNNHEQEVPKIEEESDSDVPLSKCKKDIISAPPELARSTPIKQEEITNAPITKIEFPSEPASDSEEEIAKCSDTKFKARKLKEQIRKSKELNNIRDITSKLLKKPAFGDGSDFYPGWEEELYNYKKSLRIPRNLIQVTRPPNCNRLSTSLPDLDPCPSPTPSSVADASEYCKFKTKTKSENFDSDMDSNSSFNFSLSKSFDSDEGSSVKSMNVPNKIMDRLLERYGGKKRKRLKKKEEQQGGPKVIPKSDNILELLPTPSLEIKEEQTKKSRAPIIKRDSVFFGFRKETVESFKDTFIKNSKSLVGVSEQFATVVLKSRTRTETRVLKQKATMREVFGEDRPASAPPVTCVDELKDQKVEIKKETEDTTSNDKSNEVQTTKEVLKNKLLKKKSTSTPEDVKKPKSQSDGEEEAKKEVPKVELCVKSETPSLDGEENVANKKKSKFRNIRRKGSSGFDYIRKKKKQVKKEASETTEAAKNKRRSGLPKTNLESVQDIQKEIKMWVLNKGIGETHLHRSARLGYTDITAYCLEKMQCSPSPKDNAGYTPLHEACSRGRLEIAKLLLMYGANASESAQGGIRPLHEAAENGYVEIVRLLLSYGADPNLATYSGSTPLSLTTEESTITLLKNHINDIQGTFSKPWSFYGPASCFDPEETGYDPLDSPPTPDPLSEDEDVDFEVSEVILPNLYTLSGEPPTDRWVLLQDLSNLLKIKSKDALLRQINPPSPGTSSSSSSGHKAVLRELKMADFLEQARCCQFLNAGEKINGRSSKVALVKYTDKVRQLLNVEKVLITAR